MEKEKLDLSSYNKNNLGNPGSFPFTRGIHPEMYRTKLWTMRQYAGFGTASSTNRRFKYLLEQGQTGLSVAFDLPTQMGYDSDHDLAFGEVGRVGVAVDTIDDMEELFNEIPLEQVSTSMTINATAPILLSMYVALADRRGIPRSSLSGTVQNDILKEYIARGTYIYPISPSLRLTTDLIEFCSLELPKWNPISVSGYHMREAGATAIEEVAFTLANGLTYIEAAKQRGLSVNTVGTRVSFFFAAHSNLFEEIAKFRAARSLWAKLMKEKCGATDPKAMMLRFHTQTGGVTLTAQQPLNNIIRVTLQALAAVLGGTQSLHTNSYDEAIALPSEEAATIALRTQQILAYETGIRDLVDPIGGSYILESMTSTIKEQAVKLMERIDNMGGVLAAIEKGFIQNQIHKSAFEYQKRIEKEEETIVGVNKFTAGSSQKVPVMTLNPSLAECQVINLQGHKKQREPNTVNKNIDHLKKAAQSSENLIPHIINGVKANLTLGEISDALRTIFGTYNSTVPNHLSL